MEDWEDEICWLKADRESLKPEISREFNTTYYNCGDKVVVALVENGKQLFHAYAICHPHDKFDFEVGKKLAFTRAVELKKNKKRCKKCN